MWELEPFTSNSAFTAEREVGTQREKEKIQESSVRWTKYSTQLPADSFKKQMTSGYSNHDSI